MKQIFIPSLLSDNITLKKLIIIEQERLNKEFSGKKIKYRQLASSGPFLIGTIDKVTLYEYDKGVYKMYVSVKDKDGEPSHQVLYPIEFKLV